tara:strand:- start:4515 stop:5546 length:1032 start_codon:yes stop_codon:yes gene_type:complete
MHSIQVRNVHEALLRGTDLFRGTVLVQKQESRAGTTLEAKTPVATTYFKPNERVLFWEKRDANPFFHFFEGLWMLAGREDAAYLTKFNKRMSEFSDNGHTFNGAYGYRWKNHFKKDQIDIVCRRLKTDPNDRRCVLAIWDCTHDLDRQTLDTPCNTHIYVKIRNAKLNITVCCRSNDMIWGAYGANAVHFSMLQEYMAAKIGVEVGVYTQISDSFHVYKDVFDKLETKLPQVSLNQKYSKNPYDSISPFPMVQDPMSWDNDLQILMSDKKDKSCMDNPFFLCVAKPMLTAWDMHKRGETKQAIFLIEDCCEAEDWKKACIEWLSRRIRMKEEKDIYTDAVIGI